MWPLKPLSKVCKVFTDGDWIEKKDQSESGIRLIQTGNVGEGSFKDRAEKARYINEDTFNRLKCTEIFSGDCLISRLPDPVGRACIIPELNEKLITAVDCSILRFKKDEVFPDFFKYYSLSRSYLRDVEHHCTGATRKRISRKNLGKVMLPVPPFEEQKRIVAILDEAFAGIDQTIANTEQNIQNAHELFESYLNAIFTQKGEGWEESTIEKTCTLKSGTSLKKDLEKNSGDIPYVKVADMSYEGNERGIVGSSRYVTFNDVSPNSIFPVGSVIFPKRGGAIATNKKRITEVEICADLNIMAVWSDGELNNEYLYYYFKSVDMAKLGSGTTIPQINNYDIAPLVICYPKNKSEQDQIVYNLSVVEAETNSLISVYEEKFSALKELKQSLLQKAFAGELTSDLSEAA